MVEDQLRVRDIVDERVLTAMARVPRELFVPSGERPRAFADAALPIGHDQTISQPYMVARICEILGLTGRERVLDVGTGSGYQAAVLAELAAEVHTIERIPELAEQARAEPRRGRVRAGSRSTSETGRSACRSTRRSTRSRSRRRRRACRSSSTTSSSLVAASPCRSVGAGASGWS